MEKLHYSITINVPKEKVWHTMLDLETYKQWTGPFYPGSYFEGGWEKGSDIKFVAETDGKVGGLYGRIVENKPYEYVSIEYIGQIVDGEVDTQSEDARTWIGAHENYRFTEINGATTVDIELIGTQNGNELAGMFDDMWPKSLQKLKELAEQ
jgi:uncharacterized protein YndB with AHSA1/START domain